MALLVELCRQLGLFAAAAVSVDGPKFKAVNLTRVMNIIGIRPLMAAIRA